MLLSLAIAKASLDDLLSIAVVAVLAAANSAGASDFGSLSCATFVVTVDESLLFIFATRTTEHCSLPALP